MIKHFKLKLSLDEARLLFDRRLWESIDASESLVVMYIRYRICDFSETYGVVLRLYRGIGIIESANWANSTVWRTALCGCSVANVVDHKRFKPTNPRTIFKSLACDAAIQIFLFKVFCLSVSIQWYSLSIHELVKISECHWIVFTE